MAKKRTKFAAWLKAHDFSSSPITDGLPEHERHELIAHNYAKAAREMVINSNHLPDETYEKFGREWFLTQIRAIEQRGEALTEEAIYRQAMAVLRIPRFARNVARYGLQGMFLDVGENICQWHLETTALYFNEAARIYFSEASEIGKRTLGGGHKGRERRTRKADKEVIINTLDALHKEHSRWNLTALREEAAAQLAVSMTTIKTTSDYYDPRKK